MRKGTTGAEQPHEPPASPAPIRILVVDDDRVDRMALARTLAQIDRPVELSEADGVVSAIELLTRGSYRCVILDYNLPDGDGLTFLRGMRAAGLEIPVVMLTGQPDQAMARALMEAGAADYVPKEWLTAERLARGLRRALGEA